MVVASEEGTAYASLDNCCFNWRPVAGHDRWLEYWSDGRWRRRRVDGHILGDPNDSYSSEHTGSDILAVAIAYAHSDASVDARVDSNHLSGFDRSDRHPNSDQYADFDRIRAGGGMADNPAAEVAGCGGFDWWRRWEQVRAAGFEPARGFPQRCLRP